jgi:D-apionolactonase
MSLVPVRAGPVKALLDGADLRYVRLGGVELVRRLHAAVRDRDWATVPFELSRFELTRDDESFEAAFDARCSGPALELAWSGRIAGSPDGRLAYEFDGRALSDLVYNRIGLCVLHPWRETKGRPYRARTPDGEISGELPELIGPQGYADGVYLALLPAFDRLEIALEAGGAVRFELEGDLFETEDQRNWTDASFKTYSTPLALGYPHRLAAGAALTQRITVVPVGVPSTPDAGEGPVRLCLGEPVGFPLPPIGLGHPPGAVAERELERLRALAPAHLRADVRLVEPGWEGGLAGAAEAAERLGCPLELAVHLRDEQASLLERLAGALAGGPRVERVLVLYADPPEAAPEETTPPPLVRLVRDALAGVVPGAAFAGGTDLNFTELNRSRRSIDELDAVFYPIQPQVHASGDLDLVETLEVQAETVRSAHAFAGGLPVVVSPVTLAPRTATDPRQASLLGAAWTAGSLKYLAESGAAAVTYHETVGVRGVVERGGDVFPLYHPLADAAGWRGTDVLRCESSAPLRAVGLALRTDHGTSLLVANLTAEPQQVFAGPLHGSAAVRRLREETAELARSDPERFRAEQSGLAADGAVGLRLAPFETARVEVEDARPARASERVRDATS